MLVLFGFVGQFPSQSHFGHNNFQVAGLRSSHNMAPVAISCWQFWSFDHCKASHVCLSSPILFAVTKLAWSNLTFTHSTPSAGCSWGPKSQKQPIPASQVHILWTLFFVPQFSEITYFQVSHILWKGFASTYYLRAFYPPDKYRLRFLLKTSREHNLVLMPFSGRLSEILPRIPPVVWDLAAGSQTGSLSTKAHTEWGKILGSFELEDNINIHSWNGSSLKFSETS